MFAYILTVFREKATSTLVGFHICRYSILAELEFGDVGSLDGGKPENPREKKNPEQGNNQLQTHYIYDTGPASNQDQIILVGGGGGGGKGGKRSQ